MTIQEHPFPAVVDKDPDSEQIPVSLQWSEYMEGIGASVITMSEWPAVTEPDATLTIDDGGVAVSVTTGRLTGGTAGQVYEVTNRVTFETGARVDRSVTVQVKER